MDLLEISESDSTHVFYSSCVFCYYSGYYFHKRAFSYSIGSYERYSICLIDDCVDISYDDFPITFEGVYVYM